MNWVIRKPNNDFDAIECPFLYWSNDDGWGIWDPPTIFSDEERETLNLPTDGEWYQMNRVFEFTVKIVGTGTSEQEAWVDAQEFCLKKVSDNSYDEATDIT